MTLGQSKSFRSSINLRPSHVGSAGSLTKSNLKELSRAGKLPGLKLDAKLYTTSKMNDQEFQAISSLLLPYMTAAMQVLGSSVKMGVRAQFVETAGRSENSPLTIQIKGGKPPLHDTGRLHSAIMRPGGIVVAVSPSSATCRVSWDMPESKASGIRSWMRKTQDYEYIRGLENGANMKIRASGPLWQKNYKTGNLNIGFDLKRVEWYMAPRAFFVQGVKKGMRVGAQAGAAIMQPLFSVLDQPMPSVGRMPKFAPDVALPSTGLGMGMYFAPPTSMYKYLGIYGDLKSAFRGSFGDEAVFGFLRQYGWGHVGATKKSARRKFRRSIYY